VVKAMGKIRRTASFWFVKAVSSPGLHGLVDQDKGGSFEVRESKLMSAVYTIIHAQWVDLEKKCFKFRINKTCFFSFNPSPSLYNFFSGMEQIMKVILVTS